MHCNETKNHSGEAAALLELIANWILQIAHEGSLEFQEKILTAITPVFQELDSTLVSQKSFNDIDNSNNSTSKTFNDTSNLSSENLTKIPSLFAVKLIFKLYNIDLNKLNSKHCYSFGNKLAEFLLKNHQHLNNNKIAEFLLKNRQHLNNNKIFLENLQSLNKYQNAIPAELYNFFRGIIEKLLLR